MVLLRRPRIAAALWMVLVSTPLARAQAPAGERVRESGGDFIGPATCDSTSCHGSGKPGNGRVLQNEFLTWFGHDSHRRAWEVLSAPLGRAMGERLGIDDVTNAKECLVCHAVPAGGATRLYEFGVSCEACHGAASGWYGTHFQKGFDRANAVAHQGLVDLKEPATLAAKCLSCHLGDATRVVDHRLIAAGHPDLFFEAGSFLLSMPPHWRQRGAASQQWHARAALVGQAVALREQMIKVARDAAADAGVLEFADFECASCHHDLEGSGWDTLREWRLARGLPVPVGRPLFDGARFVTASAVAAAVEPELSVALDAALERVAQLASGGRPDAAVLATAANEAAALADRAARALNELPDPARTMQLVIERLGRESERIAAAGQKGAEQAAHLLHSLRAEFERDSWTVTSTSAAAAVRARLLAPLTRPEEFQPADFARALADLARQQ